MPLYYASLASLKVFHEFPQVSHRPSDAVQVVTVVTGG